jgi:hypothetical protein
MFRVKKIRAELETALKQRDQYAALQQEAERERDRRAKELNEAQGALAALKATIAGTQQMTAYELEIAVSELTKRKAKVEADIERATVAYEQRFNERKAQVKAEVEAWRNATEQGLKERWTKAEAELAALQHSHATTKQALDKQIKCLQDQIQALGVEIQARKREVIVLEDELLLQSYGFYTPKYDFPDSGAYKAKLDVIRENQIALVKANMAANFPTTMTLNNSLKEGERMIKEYVKLTIRSFNNECDASIGVVKFNNVQSIEKKITKAHETLNKLTARLDIGITNEYLRLKLAELYLVHEYRLKKQDEKEEQKRIREQMREEAKLAREIEEARLKIEKEEKHFTKALESVTVRIEAATSELERQSLEREKAIIEKKLAATEKAKMDVEYREQHTRAGYVYVISNIGAFGENVYKIGVTRRLEPEERVDELGDASVPFDFDIHAMIFSDDAPALENALHKAFESRRLNLINRRREFFHVTLTEIEAVVRSSFDKPVEVTHTALAEEFRESENRRKGQ